MLFLMSDFNKIQGKLFSIIFFLGCLSTEYLNNLNTICKDFSFCSTVIVLADDLDSSIENRCLDSCSEATTPYLGNLF